MKAFVFFVCLFTFHSLYAVEENEFEQLQKNYNFEKSSTEQSWNNTQHLSSIMHTSISQGMQLLIDADFQVLKGFKEFKESYLPHLTKKIRSCLEKGGRIFLVGSGSSGRIALDLSAKWKAACLKNTYNYHFQDAVIGIIAGGDSAIVKAKEGFEDCMEAGIQAMQQCGLSDKDQVILISASGSSCYNVGCALEACRIQAKCYYFYNSKQIPERTKNLFDKNNVQPILIDIGPQSISGSTRLQAATLGELCLGFLLTHILTINESHSLDQIESFNKRFEFSLTKGMESIRKAIPKMQQFVEIERDIFSHPQANFRKLRDESRQGYVTFISGSDAIREILIDTTETAPTFSVNPPRKTEEIHKKRPEFQAFIFNAPNNQIAWEILLNRPVHEMDIQDTQSLLIDQEGFKQRYTDKGNFVIGVVKETENAEPIYQTLEAVKKQGGETGMIFCMSNKDFQKINLEKFASNHTITIQFPFKDKLGLISTVLLKQVLNLLSNSSMILMNKVEGNKMVDVRVSNKKLQDRCLRLTKEILENYGLSPPPDDSLFQLMIDVEKLKRTFEEDHGQYTPSTVKIMLAMIALDTDFKEAIQFLYLHNESIESIFSTASIKERQL